MSYDLSRAGCTKVLITRKREVVPVSIFLVAHVVGHTEKKQQHISSLALTHQGYMLFLWKSVYTGIQIQSHELMS